MHVGIVGGGITGLSAAYYLRKAGQEVTILESESSLGGLVRSFDFGPFEWDKFYHCILTSDEELLSLLDDLDLSAELRWSETKTGFYSAKGLHSVSNSLEFVLFPALNVWEKFRLALGILRASRVREDRGLERIRVTDWLTRIFGRGVYEKFWEPLLKCKLGSCREEASAAFIWGYISRYYSTREKGVSKKERLGYVRGSYRTVLARLVERLEILGATFLLDSPVEKIEAGQNNTVRVRTRGVTHQFDRVIFTGPSDVFARVTSDLEASYAQKLLAVKYLGVVCAALLLRRPLSPFYITNLIDSTLPFTGVIEMTAMVSREETAGRHLVYLPRYTVPNDPVFSRPDEEVWGELKAGLVRMHPNLAEEEIERVFVFRARYVQPIPVLGYSDLVPSMETGVPGLYLANTTFIINKTLSNNQMVRIARKAVQQVLASCGEESRSLPSPHEQAECPVGSPSAT